MTHDTYGVLELAEQTGAILERIEERLLDGLARETDYDDEEIQIYMNQPVVTAGLTDELGWARQKMLRGGVSALPMWMAGTWYWLESDYITKCLFQKR